MSENDAVLPFALTDFLLAPYCVTTRADGWSCLHDASGLAIAARMSYDNAIRVRDILNAVATEHFPPADPISIEDEEQIREHLRPFQEARHKVAE